MNKLITTNTGGFPFKSDDLRFVDNAIREGLNGLLSSLMMNFPSAVLGGCYIADLGSAYRIYEGYIFYNHEIWYVPQHDLTKVVGQTLYFCPELTWDAAGSKTFKSGDVHDTYQVRRMKLYYYASPPSAGFTLDSINSA
jgi:hypothetical protein